jgi:hypothetical protein
MRLGAYILRQKGVSNFDDCKRVWQRMNL